MTEYDDLDPTAGKNASGQEDAGLEDDDQEDQEDDEDES